MKWTLFYISDVLIFVAKGTCELQVEPWGNMYYAVNITYKKMLYETKLYKMVTEHIFLAGKGNLKIGA
jgi:hypothetical protein